MKLVKNSCDSKICTIKKNDIKKETKEKKLFFEDKLRIGYEIRKEFVR